MSSSTPYNIRYYQDSDFESICQLFSLNSPAYFDANEINDLKDYLTNKKEDYFVIELQNKIIASGGINYFPEELNARLSWDIVHPDFQGAGFGSLLVNHRLLHLKNMNNVRRIIVRTSQLTSKFYEKKGFNLVFTKDNFWAENFHLHQLEKLN